MVLPGAYGEVAGWDPATGRPVAAPLAREGVVFDGCAVARGPGGVRYLAMNLADHTAIVWNATGTPATPPLRHPADILQAAFSPDGSRVLTTSMDLRVRTWDATTGRLLGPPFEPTGAGMAVFSPDGARIAIAGAVANVFDVASGTAVTAGLGRDIRIVAFSRDGKRIVTVGETTARVWDRRVGGCIDRAARPRGSNLVGDVQLRGQARADDPAQRHGGAHLAGRRRRSARSFAHARDPLR